MEATEVIGSQKNISAGVTVSGGAEIAGWPQTRVFVVPYFLLALHPYLPAAFLRVPFLGIDHRQEG